jgi:cystathionine gamma-synthase
VPKLKPESLLVSAGRPHTPGAPLNAPIVPASNFLLGEGAVYAREDGTETWRAFEEALGALEGGTALGFASGMAAAAAVFDRIPLGGRAVLPADAYQGVVALAEAGAAQGRWVLERRATEDTDGWLAAATEADLCWIESPSNPMLVIADLAAIGAGPRKPGGLLVVDNTFATPLNQRPLERGADVVLHAATKYLGGHSDLLAGALVVRDRDLADALRRTRTLQGGVPGALEAFLATRGLRTLAVRLRRAEENAAALADFLAGHPLVQRVHYPGREDHPQHVLASHQLDGHGAIVSLEVAGDATAAERVCSATRLIRHATSLGSVETTMERRAAYAGQEHVPPNLLRISVGIEAIEDLQADLDQALAVLQDGRTCPSPRTTHL